MNRQTDRQTERKREIETERQTETKRETEEQADTQIDNPTDRDRVMKLCFLQNLRCLCNTRYRLSYRWDDNTMAYLPKYDTGYIDNIRCSRTTPEGKLTMLSCNSFAHKQILCERNWPEEAQASSGRQNIQLSKPSSSFGKNITEIVCPAGHWTRKFLACDARSACRQNRKHVRNNENDVKGGLMPLCLSFLSTLFTCRATADGVSYSLVCDHSQNCPDASDEDFCVYPSCSTSKQFECFNKQVRYTGECICVGGCLGLTYHVTYTAETHVTRVEYILFSWCRRLTNE